MKIAIIEDLKSDQQQVIDSLIYCIGTDSGYSLDLFNSAEDFLNEFVPLRYGLLLIDCGLDGMDGIGLAKEIRTTDTNAAIIFITASRDYAIEGYSVNACGYLLKPFSKEDFALALSRAKGVQKSSPQYLEISEGYGGLPVLLDDIIYCDIDGHYSQVHTAEGGVLRIRMPFTNIEENLRPFAQFLFCYRGCCINMLHVKKADSFNFYMDNGERIPFRKKEQKKLLQLYADYLFIKVRDS